MSMKRAALRWATGVSVGATLVWALLVGMAANAQDANVIAPAPRGSPAVTDEVTSRDGDEWSIALCAEEAVTLTMQSDAFSPLIGVFQAGDEEPLAFAEGVEGVATLAGFEVASAGVYVIVAAGDGFAARGGLG